jgi:EmrB/QacA subfamily drug resistance transporter
MTETKAERIYRRRWWTLAVLSLSLLIVTIDNTIVNVALPTLQGELSSTWSELQWIVDAYILVFAALLMTMGSLGDRLGRAHLLRAGLFIFGASSIGASFADSAVQLTAARAAMGVGGAMIFPATLAIITNVFPVNERGKALGAWGAVVGAGIALGPILGGVLIEYTNWSWIFLINVPIVAVTLVLGRFFVPNSREANPRRQDVPGTLLSGAMLGVLVFGLIKGGEWGWSDPSVIGLIVGGVTCGIAFVAWERHTSHPMMDMWLFRNPRFSSGIGTVTLLILCQMGTIFALTQYMQAVLGYSALETGIRFIPFAFGQVIGASQSHRFVNRFGTNRVIFGAFMGFAAVAIGSSFWQSDTSFLIIGPMFFFWAFCMGSIMPSCSEAILGAVPMQRAGVGSATNSAAVQVGAAIGVASLGSILSTVYSSSIKSAVAALPAETGHMARDSIGEALGVASTLNEIAGDTLASAARESFMDGWQVMVFVTAGIAIATGFIMLRLMPPRHLTPQQLEHAGIQPELWEMKPDNIESFNRE